MKKKDVRKISLSRETLRNLGEPVLRDAAGGTLKTTFSGCPGSCLQAPPTSDEPFC